MSTVVYGKKIVPIIANPIIQEDKPKTVGFAYPVKSKGDFGSSVFFSKASNVSLIRANLRQLIRTDRGERVMLPRFGLNLKKYLFQPLDEITFALIQEEILETFSKYFNKGKIISLQILGNDDSSSLVIKLAIELFDTREIFEEQLEIS